MPASKKAKTETAADGADVVLNAAETPDAPEAKKAPAKKKPAAKKPAEKKPAAKKPAAKKVEEKAPEAAPAEAAAARTRWTEAARIGYQHAAELARKKGARAK